MAKNKELKLLLLISFLACLGMFIFESQFSPNFLVKSGVKVSIFCIGIFLYYALTENKFTQANIKKISLKKLRFNLAIGGAVFILLLLGYYLISGFIDLENIKANLLTREKISKENFVYVSLYISIVNSFLEELFFRGFIFGEMKEKGHRRLGYLWSPALFALYHISIVDSWFSPVIFVLIILGLFMVGVFFNYLMEKADSFIGSWIVHGMSNVAINLIGFIMLGII